MKCNFFLPKFFFASCLLLLLSASCERNHFLLSEVSLNKKIQASWTLVRIPVTATPEQWTFDNGKLYRKSGSSLTPRDTGTYSVSTSINRATVSISGLSEIDYNTAWDIVQLDDNSFIIATDHNHTSGVEEKDFYK